MINKITQLAKERYYTNLLPITPSNATTQFGNIYEEMSELMVRNKDEYETIDALADIIVFAVSASVHFGIKLPETVITYGITNDLVAALKDMSVIALGMVDDVTEYEVSSILNNTIGGACALILELGYEPLDVLFEVHKEISNREQCPIQKKMGRVDGEKWKKNTEQLEHTRHKANYSKALTW